MVSCFGNFKDSTPGEIFEYYSVRNTFQLSLEEMAYIHLDVDSQWCCLANGKMSSSLRDLLQTVSTAFNNIRTKQYVPLLACFSVLDQIGGVYERTDKTSTYCNGIKKALDLFSSFNLPSDLDFLVTLRHGLFHDGSLTYVNAHTDTKTFVRMGIGTGRLLTPSKIPWDGVYHDDMSDYVTKIDLKEFQELTSGVVSACRRHLLDGQLRIKAGSPRELLYKYLFVV
jgi:hypothetical protein